MNSHTQRFWELDPHQLDFDTINQLGYVKVLCNPHYDFTCNDFTYIDFTYNNFTYNDFTYNDFAYNQFTYNDYTYNDFTYNDLTYNINKCDLTYVFLLTVISKLIYK